MAVYYENFFLPVQYRLSVFKICGNHILDLVEVSVEGFHLEGGREGLGQLQREGELVLANGHEVLVLEHFLLELEPEQGTHLIQLYILLQ